MGPTTQRAIVMGWALDDAPHDPKFIAGLFNWWGVEASGFSTDGGRSWTPFASYPPAAKDKKIGGSIAVSTPANIVWLPSNNSEPYFTGDGGATWAPVALPSGTREGGWSNAYYLNRHVVAADRVLPGTFYLYNTVNGLYRSDGRRRDVDARASRRNRPLFRLQRQFARRAGPGRASVLHFRAARRSERSASRAKPFHAFAGRRRDMDARSTMFWKCTLSDLAREAATARRFT